MAVRSILAGVGAYLPARVVSNDELSRTVETSDEWIRERTGIRQRYIAAPHETAAFMGTAAARAALADAGAEPAEVDAIILATSTPDQAFPATALRVQAALGVTRGFGFDLAAACAGFIYALSVADAHDPHGQARGVLVIGSEVYSRILNWQDRGTCVLFGDGAGAVFLRAGTGSGSRPRHPLHPSACAGHAWRHPLCGRRGRPSGSSGPSGDERPRGIPPRRDRALPRLSRRRLPPTAWNTRDIDWLVPHQANRRIIDAMGRKLGLPPERVVITVDRHANTSAASVPLALAEARQDGRIRWRRPGADGGAGRWPDLGFGLGPHVTDPANPTRSFPQHPDPD